MDLFIRRMVYSITKPQANMWWWLILSLIIFPDESKGLSDMKICGDSACEVAMSRVLAIKNFEAPDCRFLSFRKGDVIFVYYKLAGKRDDLWAGIRDRSFGYFPKDAVNIDEIHVSKEKEITLSTEKLDFFCIDEYGGVIEFDDSEEHEGSQPEREMDSYDKYLHDTMEDNDAFDASTHTITDQTGSEEVPHKGSPGTSEQGGSPWIPSAVSGWFGTTDQNNAALSDDNNEDFPADDDKQDTFRKRKLALDDEQLEEKSSSMFGWIGGELTNVLGYGQKQDEGDARAGGEGQPMEERKDTSGQYSSWVNVGLGDVLNFGGESTAEADRAQDTQGQGTDIFAKEGSEQPPEQKEKIGETETAESTADTDILKGNEGLLESPESSIEVVQEKDMTQEEASDWYGGMFNNIVGYYTGQEKEEHPENGGAVSEVVDGSAHVIVQETAVDSSEAETPLPSLLGNITSDTQSDVINSSGEVQHEDNLDLFLTDMDTLAKVDDFPKGLEVLPDIDGNGNPSSLEGSDNSNNQKIPFEEKNASLLPTESQIKDDKERNEEPLSNDETGFEEHEDISAEYENQDETSKVPSTENKLQHSSEETEYTAEPVTQSEVSDGSSHRSEVSDSTPEKNSDSAQSQYVTAITENTEITPSLSISTQPSEVTDILSETFVVPDGISFEKDTSDVEMSTLNEIGVDNEVLGEDSESDGEKDTVCMNIHEDSDLITNTEGSNSNTDKELIVNNQHPVSDRLVETTKSVLPEGGTDGLSIIQLKESKESQELYPHAKEEQSEISSSDFSSPVEKSHESQDNTNDQHNDQLHNINIQYNQSLEDSGSIGLASDGGFNKPEAIQKDSKHDLEELEKEPVVSDQSVVENAGLHQQEVDNESVTELLNTDRKYSHLDTLPAQADKHMENRTASTETSLRKVDLSSSENIIDDNDSVTLSKAETEADISHSKVVKARDEMESGATEISIDSDTSSHNSEDDNELKMFPSDSEDGIFSAKETVTEDNLILPDVDTLKESKEAQELDTDVDTEQMQKSISEFSFEVANSNNDPKDTTDYQHKQNSMSDEPSPLPMQTNDETKNISASTETKVPVETIINDPDSIILSEAETEADASQTEVSKTVKTDETESETAEIATDYIPSHNIEDVSELFSSYSLEDHIIPPTETPFEDTPIVPDKVLDTYMPDETDHTASVTLSPDLNTVTEEQDTEETEYTVTEVEDLRDFKLSLIDTDDISAVTNEHIDSLKTDEGNDGNVYTPHEQSTESTITDPPIKEDEMNTGWYGSVYSTFTGLYGGEIKEDDTGDSLELSDTAVTPAPDRILHEEVTLQRQEPQSLSTVEGLTSVSDSLTSNSEEDTTPIEGKDQQSEEPPTENSRTDSTAQEIESIDLEEEDTEDHRYTTEPDSVSLDNSVTSEDTAEYDHNTSPKDDYESENGIKSETPLEDEDKMNMRTDAWLTETVENAWLAWLELIRWVVRQVVSSLPDDLRPGPDLYGVPWEPVIVTAVLGLLVMLLFTCRLYQCVKSRLYARRERILAQKIEELLTERNTTLDKLSTLQKEHDKHQSALQNGGQLPLLEKSRKLQEKERELGETNAQLRKRIEILKEEVNAEKETKQQIEKQVAEAEENRRRLEESAMALKSQMEQATTTLKIHNMNAERLEKRLQANNEEKVMLRESIEQLRQEAEGWSERLAEKEEEMKMCESSQRRMLEERTKKDEQLKELRETLLKMNWDSDDDNEANGEADPNSPNGEGPDHHQQQKIEKLVYAAKLNADLRSLEEDKNRVVAKLADEIKAKEDLLEGIEFLEKDTERLQTESTAFASESQKLEQKLTIMTEMYHENELKLHRMLTVEERERLEKEEKLTKADMKISLAAEERNNYRIRADELKEEIDRTNHAYKKQIASHEKKAHDNWLAARAADRDLTDIKRENAHLRQKLTDYQFKLDVLEKDPYALDAPGRPLFRGERSPYGPSPLGRPSSETRAFLSPPTLMDGPPRLSPQFPMGPGGRGDLVKFLLLTPPSSAATTGASRSLVEPPGGGGEYERSGGPHSDSGSCSPSWERERRGPPGPPGPLPPPGHMYPEPGPPFRRPPPGAFPMGPLPPRPPFPPGEGPHVYGPGPGPGPHPADKPDFAGNSSGISDSESRDASHMSASGDLRMPPEVEMRMGPPPPMPMDPRDPHFQRRGPYGPPDFFPMRGPGGMPLGMRGPPPPGMFPRYPLPPHMGYPPSGRPPMDGFPPGPPGPPPRPSPPGSEQPSHQTPPPHDGV